MSSIDILNIFCEIALRWMPKARTYNLVNIDSGNALVSSDSKQLPEPMLTAIYVAIWRH